MKKLFISLLAIASLIGGGLSYAYYDEGGNGGAPNVKDTSGGPVGTPVRVYTLVRYPVFSPNVPSLSAGDVVLWDTISDDGITINTMGEGGVTISNDAVAGVVASLAIPTADVQGNTATQDVGRRNWGYIQTYGLNTDCNIDGTTITVGQALIPSSVARKASATVGANTNDISIANPLGFAFDATSTSANGRKVFVRTR